MTHPKLKALLAGLSFAIMAFSTPRPAKGEIVTTKEGKLQGVAGKDAAVVVFKGIPFAAPPVGELRWRPPQPVKPWRDVRAADAFGAYCVGIKFGFIPPAGMKEDCLYLNLWAPAKARTERLPVMVWIHGGGFQGGGGADPAFEGEQLAKQGLVVVTFNYRTGVFGFLAHPDLTEESTHHASGNYGLLDQVAVLEWVKRNIAAFGGDPAKVTIAGESAGSYSVSALTASPLARNLFHRAIAQSGGYLSPKPDAMRTLGESEKVGVRLSQALGAADLAALRNKGAEEVMGAVAKLGDFYAFQPGVDGRFLNEAVYATYAKDLQAKVPLLLGSNTDEGAFLIPEQRPSLKEFQTLLATAYGDAAKVQDAYPVDTPATLLRSELNFYADGGFTYPMWKWALMHRAAGMPVYYYQFGRTLPATPGQLYKGLPRAGLGAFHGDEVAYAFGNLETAFGALDQSSRKNRWERVDHELSAAMLGYWAKFVKTGDPNGGGLPLWPRYESDSKDALMRFYDQPRATPDERTERMKLLDAAYTQHERRPSSKQIEAVSTLYRNWSAAMAANPSISLEEWRDLIEGWVVLTAEPVDVDYIETDAGGIPAMWAIPKGADHDRVILSIHGGGFVTGSMYTHRKLFAHLAKSIGARALILNFGRAPEHIHPGPVDDVVAAYRWLLHQGIKPNHIAFAGDSAGGGLSVTAQIRARAQGLPSPGAALLMSPWVDMAVEGGSWITNVGKDVLFTRKESVQGLVSMFLGPSGNPRDPLANPLYADLKNLAPVFIQVGGNEVLLDDSRRLAKRARKAGVDVRLDVFPGMQHTFQMCAGRAPEADDAIRRFAEWARPRLGLGGAAASAAERK